MLDNKQARQLIQPSILSALLACILVALLSSSLSGCMTMAASHAAQKASPQPSPSPAHSSLLPTPTPTVVQQASLPTTANYNIALPSQLIIPSIQVNAPIEAVNVLANGDLATPTSDPWNDTGWYQNGPRPGEHGSAVIDGHLDRPGGAPAVFWNLQYLHVGDTIIVVSAQGVKLQFHVTAVAHYPPQQAPLQDIFGNNNGTFLNLITCAGDWIPSQHQTAQRLVVYATRS